MAYSYVDYDYYQNVYKGTSVPLQSFNLLSIQASAFINLITSNRIDKKELVSDDVKLATCSVIDSKYKVNKDGGIKVAETVGKHSVTFGSKNSDVTEESKHYKAAYIFLAHTGLLYRGVR